MEEILASIRRIIADDQSFPGRPHMETQASDVARTLVAEEGNRPEPVEATRQPNISPIRGEALPEGAPRDAEVGPSSALPHGHGFIAPQFVSPAGPDVDPASPPEIATPGAPSLASDDPPAPAVENEPDRLFSPAIDTSLTAAFNTLAASRLVAGSDELVGLVREMIRPLLKSWIDEHLPAVVEGLVKAEIERLARHGP